MSDERKIIFSYCLIQGETSAQGVGSLQSGSLVRWMDMIDGTWFNPFQPLQKQIPVI